MLRRVFFVFPLLACAASALADTPLGAGWTYQGRIKQSGQPANGSYDLSFTLWRHATSTLPADQIGSAVCAENVNVVDGLFAVQLDFGAAAFDGNARWLNVSVRSDSTPGNCGSGAYTLLSPRQPLTAAPYALYALNSPGSNPWAVNGTHIYKTNSGNVGIGATTPSARLEVFQGTGSTEPALRVQKQTSSSIFSWLDVQGRQLDSGGNGLAGNPMLLNYNNSSDVTLCHGGGNVGIGGDSADSPAVRLHVDGGGDVGLSGGGFILSGDPAAFNIGIDDNEIMARNGTNASSLFLNHNGGNVLISALGTGGVGIGTTNVPSGIRLAVDGKVLCEELEVQLSQNWPDFVFANDYDLMTLDEVRAFVQANKHLPGVPSAASVKSDGVSVGAMQATLLQKIEELTLHLIDLDRRVRSLGEENDRLCRALDNRTSASADATVQP